MSVLNKKKHFTVYGEWTDRPYERTYLVSKITYNKNVNIILNDGEFELIIHKPKIILKFVNSYVVMMSDFIELRYNNGQSIIIIYKKEDKSLSSTIYVKNKKTSEEYKKLKSNIALKIF